MCVAIVQFNMFRKDCSCILAVLQRDDLCMQPHLGAAAAFREGFTDPCLADVQSVYLFSPCLKHLKSLLKVCSKVQTRNVSPCLAMSCHVLPWFPHKMDLEEVVLRHMHEESCGACHSRGGTSKAKQILKQCDESSTLSVPQYKLWAFHIHNRTPIPPVRKRTVWPSLVGITGSDDSKSAVQSRPRPWQHGPYATEVMHCQVRTKRCSKCHNFESKHFKAPELNHQKIKKHISWSMAESKSKG